MSFPFPRPFPGPSAMVSYSVLSLFMSGEQGVWYDPSDFTTMFQDSAGTTPVTAVEQPVGLILDKSKGLALGAELVTNGDFSGGSTGWTLGTGWTISGGVASFSAGAGAELIQTGRNFAANTTYKITFDMTQVSGGGFRFVVDTTGSFVSSYFTTTASHTLVFSVGATSTRLRLGALGGANFSIDNISVKELPGNHASQSTAASRPVLSARVNLLTYSEDPTLWSTIGSTVSVKTVTATATTNRHGIINPGSTAPASTACTATVRVTRVNSDFIQIAGSSGGFYANFNISSGVVGTTGGVRVIGSSIAPVSAGTYDCTVTFTGNADQLWVILAQTASDGVLPSYAAVGTEAFICVRADMRVTNVGVGLPAYQRVAAATDYDTSGFPLYLAFDGTDDSLATGTIDFSATDKMSVFAGVRKQTDTGFGGIVELSAEVAANNGTFLIRGPASGANYFVGSKGTVVNYRTLTTYTAPITNIITLISNISGPLLQTRINGSTVDTSTTNQGTGNFGNYPLYIGRRGGTTLPYNGNLYSLIVRGALSTDAQIASTETWVNGKTGAY